MKSSTGRNLLIGCGAIVAVLVLCGCAAVLINVLGQAAGMPSIVATVPPATETEAIAEPTSAPVSEATDEPTGGLGATRSWWDDAWTYAGDDLLGPIFEASGGRSYIVTFVDGRAQRVEIRFAEGREAMNDLIGATALSVMPNDVRLGDLYQPDPTSSPEIYVLPGSSAWLAGLFSEEWWFGSDPGSLNAKYNLVDGKVSTIIVSTGNNP